MSTERALRSAGAALAAALCLTAGALAGEPPAGPPAPFPDRRVLFGSQGHEGPVTSAAWFVFARTGEPRLRVRVEDREGTLACLEAAVNGRPAVPFDRDGLVVGRAARGFDADWSSWVSLPGARRGMNHVRLSPAYRARPSLDRQPLRASWDGEAQLGRSVLADPPAMLRGLRELAAAEEELYYHLRQFDQYLRDLPRACFPAAFERASALLPARLARAWADLRSRPFVALVQDFHRQAWGVPVDVGLLLEAVAARLQRACWVFEAPGSRPLAAYLYATNPEGRFLHAYFSDVLLAKRAVKNAYLELLAPGCALGEAELDAALVAQREEVRRLSDLVQAAAGVSAACDREAARVYGSFPWWRTVFRQAFSAKVRARIWPTRNYPLREDLFAEQVMLREYFEVVATAARQDLQQARVRAAVLEAVLRFPARAAAVPGLAPWHAEDEP